MHVQRVGGAGCPGALQGGVGGGLNGAEELLVGAGGGDEVAGELVADVGLGAVGVVAAGGLVGCCLGEGGGLGEGLWRVLFEVGAVGRVEATGRRGCY